VTLEIVSIDELDRVVVLLARGDVVAVPTDTVYGLAAQLDRPDAVAALFDVKHRPRGVPVAVLCATPAQAAALSSSWPRSAQRLATAFWPGALTVVVSCDEALASRLGAELGVGLRVPDDSACAALLARTGPLAVTSANLHGASPCTSAQDVVAGFTGTAVSAVLDGGVRDGVVSTVVDVRPDVPVIVRPGAVSADDVQRTIAS
jgi:L-threonylcarbamoyladenylate synthase